MFDKSSISTVSGTFFLPLASPDLTCADKCQNQDSPGRCGRIVTVTGSCPEIGTP